MDGVQAAACISLVVATKLRLLYGSSIFPSSGIERRQGRFGTIIAPSLANEELLQEQTSCRLIDSRKAPPSPTM